MEFKEVKEFIIKRAREDNACSGELERAINSKSLGGLKKIVLENSEFVFQDTDLLTLQEFLDMFKTFPREFNGDLYLPSGLLPKGLILPSVIKGDINMNDCILPKDIVFPKKIHYDLFMNNCTLQNNVKLPKMVGGCMYMNNSKVGNNIIFPKEVDSLDLESSTIGDNVVLPKEVINGSLDLDETIIGKNITLPKYVSSYFYSDVKSVQDKDFEEKVEKVERKY